MRLRLVCCLTALIALLVTGVPRADADLIGLSSTDPGIVYSIDPGTGAATAILTLQDTGASFTGIDFMNGDLYATDVYPPEWRLGKIDMSTGAVTIVSTQGGSSDWHGLAADDANDIFYAIDIDDGNKLKTLDLSGNVTTIGTGTGIDGRGMAFDPITGTLYATGSDGYWVQSLYAIDTTTGAASLIGSTGITSFRIGLAFDPVAGVLFANTGSSGLSDDCKLFTINTSTGAASLVGPNAFTYAPDIDGLAWRTDVPVPEPSVLALLLGAAVPALLLRRRRR